MVANLADKLGNAGTGGLGIDMLPIVAAHSRIGNDRFQTGGMAGVQSRRRYETSHGQATVVHLGEHGLVIGYTVPCHDGKESGRRGGRSADRTAG